MYRTLPQKLWRIENFCRCTITQAKHVRHLLLIVKISRSHFERKTKRHDARKNYPCHTSITPLTTFIKSVTPAEILQRLLLIAFAENHVVDILEHPF